MASRGRSKGFIIIIIAVVLFIIVGIIAVLVLGGNFLLPLLSGGNPAAANPAAQITPTPAGAMVEIIIVQQPVARGSVLSESVLAKIPYPQSAMVEGLFYTDIEGVLGKRAKFDLQQGTPLVPSLLAESTVGSMVSMQVPKGKVAISIPIKNDYNLVSYALKSGDHVNVIGAINLVDLDANFQSKLPNSIAVVAPPQTLTSGGTEGQTVITSITAKMDPATQGRAELDSTLNQPIYVVPSEAQRSRLIAQTVIQDAIVLGIGDLSGGTEEASSAPQPTAAGGAQATPTAVPPKPKVISLIVSPQDAETLNFMVLANANITLALRNSLDDQLPATDAVTLQYIMDQYNIPYPAKLPYGLEIPAAAPTPAAGQ